MNNYKLIIKEQLINNDYQVSFRFVHLCIWLFVFYGLTINHDVRCKNNYPCILVPGILADIKDRTNAHLLALAPHIAAVKVDTPGVWDAAYAAADPPHREAALDLTAVGDPATLGPEALAAEMKRVKFLWAALGMYALDEFTDPNPRVKAAMAAVAASRAAA